MKHYIALTLASRHQEKNSNIKAWRIWLSSSFCHFLAMVVTLNKRLKFLASNFTCETKMWLELMISNDPAFLVSLNSDLFALRYLDQGPFINIGYSDAYSNIF